MVHEAIAENQTGLMRLDETSAATEINWMANPIDGHIWQTNQKSYRVCCTQTDS